MKRTLTAVALALSLASAPAHAAFQNGWNKIYILNCYTFTTATIVSVASTPGLRITGNTQVDVLWVFPDTTKRAGLTTADTFSTTDPIYVTTLSPFCISGAPLFVHFFQLSPALWDAISVYPRLS